MSLNIIMVKNSTSWMVSIISISKLTDILVILVLTVITCVSVFLLLGDDIYNMILAFVLLLIADSIYAFIKIKDKHPPRDTGHYP